MKKICRPNGAPLYQGEIGSISRPNIAVGAIASEMWVIVPGSLATRVQRAPRGQHEFVCKSSPSYGR